MKDSNPTELLTPKKAEKIPAVGNIIPGDVIIFEPIDIKIVAKITININVIDTSLESNPTFASISSSKDFEVA